MKKAIAALTLALAFITLPAHAGGSPGDSPAVREASDRLHDFLKAANLIPASAEKTPEYYELVSEGVSIALGDQGFQAQIREFSLPKNGENTPNMLIGILSRTLNMFDTKNPKIRAKDAARSREALEGIGAIAAVSLSQNGSRGFVNQRPAAVAALTKVMFTVEALRATWESTAFFSRARLGAALNSSLTFLVPLAYGPHLLGAPDWVSAAVAGVILGSQVVTLPMLMRARSLPRRLEAAHVQRMNDALQSRLAESGLRAMFCANEMKP